MSIPSKNAPPFPVRGDRVTHEQYGAGTVTDLVFQGGFKRARIASEAEPGLNFTVHVPVGTPLAVGERVELHCSPDEIIPLDE